jgi:hypothetical protein
MFSFINDNETKKTECLRPSPFNVQPTFGVNGIPVHVGLKIYSVFFLITIMVVLIFYLLQ